MTLPEIPETQSPPENQNSELGPSSQTLRYQLRANRAPRYKCGTCGSRNCSCVKRLACDSPDHRLTRGAVIPARELSMARAPYHPQHEILTVQAQREKVEAPPLVHHLVITVEKTFTSVEREVIPPLEETLRAMHATSPSDCPTYRFKEWTPPHRGGLEFTLHAIIPPLPPSITFGELAEEDSSPEMVRCITAHQLWEKYRIASPPGDIYQPTKGWWLLATSLDATTLVSPTTLLMCLESLRTVTDPESTLFPPGRHPSRQVPKPTLATIDCGHLLPTGEDILLGSAILYAGKTCHGQRSTLHSTRLVIHQHGR